MSETKNERFFEKELTGAHSAIANVCGLDKNSKKSYSIYLESVIEDTEPNITKGLDLHIFGHIQSLCTMIEELDTKIAELDKELEVYKTIVNKLFKD